MSRIFFACVAISCGGETVGEDGGDSAADVTDSSIDAQGDSADVGEVVADGDGGFNVATVPGLVLWLDAAKGVTKNNQNQVSAWADESGKMNNAFQSTPSRQPIHHMNGINGLPTLHFAEGMTTGTQLVINDSVSMQWGTTDFLIEVVARFDNDPTGNLDTGIGMFVFKPGAGSGIVFAGNRLPAGVLPASSGVMARIDMDVPGNGNQVDVSASYNDNAPHNFGFRRSGGTLDLRVGGVSVAGITQFGNVDVSAAGIDVYVGSDNTATKARLDGDIAELIGVKGSTSNTDLVAIESYLKAKYKL